MLGRGKRVAPEEVGRSVSCDGEAESEERLHACYSADSGSGVSSRYLRVVEGNMAIVSISLEEVELGAECFFIGGKFRFEVERFIMIAPSSGSLSLSSRPSEG